MPARPHERMPVLVATAPSPSASLYIADAHAADARVAALGGRLELEGHRHLVGGGDVGQALGPQVELGRRRRRRAWPGR